MLSRLNLDAGICVSILASASQYLADVSNEAMEVNESNVLIVIMGAADDPRQKLRLSSVCALSVLTRNGVALAAIVLSRDLRPVFGYGRCMNFSQSLRKKIPHAVLSTDINRPSICNILGYLQRVECIFAKRFLVQ